MAMNLTIVNTILKEFFSMRLMALALFVFLAAIAIATFIESLYGIQDAKILVYNHWWFEILLVYLGMSLISNITRYKMWQREKIALLTFHLSFIIIIIGAGVTRKFGFEGIMVVPEGSEINYIYTGDPHILINIQNPKKKESAATFTEKKLFSIITDNSFELRYDVEGKPLTISYVDFKAKCTKAIESNASIKEFGIELFTNGRKSNTLFKEEVLSVSDVPITLNTPLEAPGIEIKSFGDSLMIKSAVPIEVVKMSELKQEEQKTGIQDSTKIKTIPVNTWYPFTTRTLYKVGNDQFVFNRILANSRRGLVPTGNLKEGLDYLTVSVTYDGKKKEVQLEGGMGNVPTFERFELGEMILQLEYGAIRKTLPFTITCKDFQLDHYPGSQAPSSFASVVQVKDPRSGEKFDQRIFMNNVMDYDGYRFFQSSYKLDDPSTPENEEATLLQVNSDLWGTNITYFGYLMMSIAMILSLFASVGRFRLLNQKLKGLQERRKNLSGIPILLGILCFQQVSIAQINDHSSPDLVDFSAYHQVISEDHSDKLAKLLIQEIKYNHEQHQFTPTGRIIPFHTIADRLLRKICRGTSFDGKNPVQVIFSMHLYQQHWAKQNIIQVPTAVREQLKLEEYASFSELTEENGQFKWMEAYEKAHIKLESQRSEFDKKLIKLNEKFEVVKGIFSWNYFRIAPLDKDKQNRWLQPKRMYEGIVNPYVLDTVYFHVNLENLQKANDTSNYLLFAEMYNALYPSKNINEILAMPPPTLFIDILHFSPIQKAQQSGNYKDAEELLGNYKNFLEKFVNLSPADIETSISLLRYMLITTDEAARTGDFTKADALLAKIIARQRSIGKDVVPTETMVDAEIRYNKMQIFKNTGYGYALCGFLMLILFFWQLFIRHEGKLYRILNVIVKVFFWLIIAMFLYHGAGIGMRWAISGHAPWSNGYEALVFIAWVTMIAGIAFSRKNAAVLPATALLAFFMLFVTEQNLMDPEITPLVPVLQSYWLMIHVAIITGSYGFLGLGAILGLINTLLFIFKRQKNKTILDINISELTYVSDMTITIGLFMLTIGTFLGGVWANESWGRYWAWDPKETWALVSVLVYAILLHLRFIPQTNTKFIYNTYSLWGYSAILFTFFGVNFMLVGLHSYAQGEGLGSLPNWLLYTVAIFYFISELAATRNTLMENTKDRSIKTVLKYIAIKLVIVTSIFLSVYLIFKSYIDSSNPAQEYLFTSFKYLEYALLTLLVIVGVNALLIPLKMRWILKSW